LPASTTGTNAAPPENTVEPWQFPEQPCVTKKTLALVDTAAIALDALTDEPEYPRTVAVDCGFAINPLTVESQMQGGLTFGLTQLMAKGAITLTDGRVVQRNFDAFTPPYMKDAPMAVDVHIVPSSEAPRLRHPSPIAPTFRPPRPSSRICITPVRLQLRPGVGLECAAMRVA
jgi:hypothetical protein